MPYPQSSFILIQTSRPKRTSFSCRKRTRIQSTVASKGTYFTLPRQLFFSLFNFPASQWLSKQSQNYGNEIKHTDTQTGIPSGIPLGAKCVQRFDESRFCNSHYVSHFAAFFIDARAKRSIAESYWYVLLHDNFTASSPPPFSICPSQPSILQAQ